MYNNFLLLVHIYIIDFPYLFAATAMGHCRPGALPQWSRATVLSQCPRCHLCVRCHPAIVVQQPPQMDPGMQRSRRHAVNPTHSHRQQVRHCPEGWHQHWERATVCGPTQHAAVHDVGKGRPWCRSCRCDIYRIGGQVDEQKTCVTINNYRISLQVGTRQSVHHKDGTMQPLRIQPCQTRMCRLCSMLVLSFVPNVSCSVLHRPNYICDSAWFAYQVLVRLICIRYNNKVCLMVEKMWWTFNHALIQTLILTMKEPPVIPIFLGHCLCSWGNFSDITLRPLFLAINTFILVCAIEKIYLW